MSTDSASQVIEFHVRATSSSLGADAVRTLVDEAVAEAVAESTEVVRAHAEMPGAFGGVGETLIVVAIFLGKAVAGGAAGAAGKHFYESVLKPKLEKKNLVASPADVRDDGGKGSAQA